MPKGWEKKRVVEVVLRISRESRGVNLSWLELVRCKGTYVRVIVHNLTAFFLGGGGFAPKEVCNSFVV